MINYVRESQQVFKRILDSVIATNNEGVSTSLDKALEDSINMITEQTKGGKKVILIGNGGSAAIASHLSTDFLKNAEIPATAFTDPSLLTCLSNDFGYKYVFEKPIEVLAESGDILIAISSSGQSENILRGVSMAKDKGAQIITFSGFKENNPLRGMGEINFYVPASHYGHVEIIHLFLGHCLVDVVVKNKSEIIQKATHHE